MQRVSRPARIFKKIPATNRRQAGRLLSAVREHFKRNCSKGGAGVIPRNTHPGNSPPWRYEATRAPDPGVIATVLEPNMLEGR